MLTKEEAQTELVNRLRSDKYPQGTGFLNRNGAFCCLGVACEIAVEQGIISSRTDVNRFSGTAGVVHYGQSRETTYLPSEVKKFFGFRTYSGGFCPNMETPYECLADMNDQGKTFFEIADLIERRPLLIFE